MLGLWAPTLPTSVKAKGLAVYLTGYEENVQNIYYLAFTWFSYILPGTLGLASEYPGMVNQS